MTLSVLTGIMVLLAASTLGALEYAMSPAQKRFPCVPSGVLWALRVHTVFLVFAATDRLWRAYDGNPLETTAYQFLAATTMAAAYTGLLILVLRLRLNEGVWPRLQARIQKVRRLDDMGGLAGPVLARSVAGADLADDLPVTRETLEKLARMP